MLENLGNPSSPLLLVVSTIVLALTVGAYRGARKVAQDLSPMRGGRFARIISGVVFGLLIAQLLAVLNVAVVVFATNPVHGWVRLIQQLVVAATAIWAWYQIRKLGG